MLVIPATWEAEAEESLEPKRQRLRWAEIAPLHSSLGNESETPSQKKKKKLRMEPRTSGLPNGVSPSRFHCLCVDPSRWKHLLPWSQLFNIVSVRNVRPTYERVVRSLRRHLMITQTTTPFCILIPNTLSLQISRRHPAVFAYVKLATVNAEVLIKYTWVKSQSLLRWCKCSRAHV